MHIVVKMYLSKTRHFLRTSQFVSIKFPCCCFRIELCGSVDLGESFVSFRPVEYKMSIIRYF